MSSMMMTGSIAMTVQSIAFMKMRFVITGMRTCAFTFDTVRPRNRSEAVLPRVLFHKTKLDRARLQKFFSCLLRVATDLLQGTHASTAAVGAALRLHRSQMRLWTLRCKAAVAPVARIPAAAPLVPSRTSV